MRIDHDVCRIALENLHDEGVYVVDKERLTIYYRGKASCTSLGPGVSHGTKELGLGSEPEPLVSEVPGGRSGLQRFCGAGSGDHGKAAGSAESLSLLMEPSQVLTSISPVKNQDGETVGAVQVFEDRGEIERIRRRLRELEKIVLLDPLTRVGNRRYAEIHLQCCLDEMHRYDWPFGVLFIDVDHFKSINDSFGHAAGDDVLRGTAQTLVSGLRSSDLVCRWGGEEFVVVVKNVNRAQIAGIAEKVRSFVAQSCIPTDYGLLGVTISVGATVGRSDDSVASLIDRADKLMYASKQGGRNRVTLDVDGTLPDSFAPEV